MRSCSGAWRGPVVRSTGSSRAVPLLLRRGLGSGSYSHSTGPFWFSFDSAISTPGMHIALLGECRPPYPLGSPVLDLSMTRSSPSFRPAGAGQTGWWQASRARQTEPSLQPRCQLGPSGCLMHDSVATASALRGRKTGPAGPAPAGDGRAGSRKSGVPVVLHRSVYGPPSRPPMDWLLRSLRDQRMGTDRQVNQPAGQS